jgi:hypothetical protein
LGGVHHRLFLWVEPATTDRVSRRSIIYVDGFNLYYGAVRGTPHKWLDLEKYFRFVRKDDEIIAIRYFTAMVQGPGRLRQREYLRALATLPLVTVYEGRFKKKKFKCRVTSCTHDGDRRYPGFEEKRTDVSIAVEMMRDAFHDECDTFVVVSGDADLVPAVSAIKV